MCARAACPSPQHPLRRCKSVRLKAENSGCILVACKPWSSAWPEKCSVELYRNPCRQTIVNVWLAHGKPWKIFAQDKHWLAALANEGNVFESPDPEDEQLIRALERFTSGSIKLLTRDELLCERYPEITITPQKYFADSFAA
ncbi:MAG: hypothetical protein IPP22_00950 [Nitrosomonas sp.]|nr:hypothetical protein [Nitrosomonas sp.]